jgi:pimeloyl-ACP methyl ester carboxylesterase
MRGFDLSDKPEGVGSYALEELVEDVRHLIEVHGASRASIVGHDWGAIVAWFFAMTYPDAVDRLAILNVPHPGRFAQGVMNLRQVLKSWYVLFFQLPQLPEIALRFDDFKPLRDLLRSSPGFTDEAIEDYVEAARRSDGFRHGMNYYRAFLRRNFIATLRDLTVIERPTLVIWGDRDPLIEPSLAEPSRDWVPNLRFERLPEAGHWPHVDEPDVVNRLLIEHLTESG